MLAGRLRVARVAAVDLGVDEDEADAARVVALVERGEARIVRRRPAARGREAGERSFASGKLRASAAGQTERYQGLLSMGSLRNVGSVRLCRNSMTSARS